MKIFDNFQLEDYNAYKVKSLCRRAYFPESENDLITIYNESKGKKVLLGNGNNIVLSKDFYEQDFIIFNGNFNKKDIEGTCLVAESGATLLCLSEIALANSLSGFEPFFDIPSSVGGAVVMNAGTKEGEIKDILMKVRYFDLTDKQIKELNKDQINFGYRDSIFQNNTDKIITQAWFSLKKDDENSIRNRMYGIRERRWVKQPRDLPNCGSVFKRPPGRFVGPMIEELGLKGFAIGGAKISEKHAGFIVNFNNAAGKDILELIEYVKSRVFMKFGVNLEIEQRII